MAAPTSCHQDQEKEEEEEEEEEEEGWTSHNGVSELMMPRGADVDDNSVVLLRARRFVAHRMLMKDLFTKSSKVQSQLQSLASSTVVPAEQSCSLIRGSLRPSPSSGSSTTTISSATTFALNPWRKKTVSGGPNHRNDDEI